MLSLGDQKWGLLEHAYGSAGDIPALLLQLEALPDGNGESEPWFSIWSALAHQGDVYSASFAAVPHVVRCLASSPETADGNYFQFPAWVEICREKGGIEVPDELAHAYRAALAQLPTLVAVAAKRVWDEGFLRCALSAVAASKGFAQVAEAVMELEPKVAEEFLQWVSER
jgi:hypothetical protein